MSTCKIHFSEADLFRFYCDAARVVAQHNVYNVELLSICFYCDAVRVVAQHTFYNVELLSI